MRQCLRIATFFGEMQSPTGIKYMDMYLNQVWQVEDSPKSTISKREGPFYSTKVASSLAKVLTRVLEGTDPAADTPEMKTWRGLRARTKEIVWASTKPEVKTPYSELQPLGSAVGLEATERFVDYDWATRSQKTTRSARR